MFSVVRCQMSMILLWRSPAVMTPELRWVSTSRTSLCGRRRYVLLLAGMTMSSTPIEMPARVAAAEAQVLQVVEHLDRHLLAEVQVARS